MVVDDVENDFDSSVVKRLDHLLELANLPASRACRTVRTMRGEIADGVIAPIVGESAFEKEGLIDEVMDRQEFNGADPKAVKVLDGSGLRQSGVGSAGALRGCQGGVL